MSEVRADRGRQVSTVHRETGIKDRLRIGEAGKVPMDIILAAYAAAGGRNFDLVILNNGIAGTGRSVVAEPVCGAIGVRSYQNGRTIKIVEAFVEDYVGSQRGDGQRGQYKGEQVLFHKDWWGFGVFWP